ncbi:MAG TPA: hypothetical protein VFG24_04100, partial [Nitrosopumilaceae archaeon]|nr:hypothetical protein [Nitrosopumilaceae archaeon]
ILSYNTTKHNTSLSLLIQPNPVTHGATYKVGGVLKDTVTGTTLSSKTILFKADNHITIASATTDSSGKYLVSALTAPSAGSYRIQDKFNGDSFYNSGTSQMKTLTVS